MQKTRLERFKETPERIARYREAIRILQEIGVDQILLELAQPENIVTSSQAAGNAAIASLYDSIGYKRCVEELFTLDEVTGRVRIPLVTDFGASEKMGLSPDEIKEYVAQ